MDSVFIITSEYNDSCGCHPEYITSRVGATKTREAAEAYIKNAPTITLSRNISRTLSYDIEEISLLD
jgi:hypothetical protein